MIVVGIDPGLSGAVCVMDHNGVRAIFDLPTMPVPGAGPKALVKKKIDGHALCKLLLQHCPADEGKPNVFLEKVSTMGGADNAVQTQGSLMRTLGAIETVFECLDWPCQQIAPQTWKRTYGIGSNKTMALEAARTLHPEAGHDLRLAKHHNRAEAVLLAHWGRKEIS